MHVLKRLPIVLALIAIVNSTPVEAAYVITDSGIQNEQEAATMPAEAHFAAGLSAIERCDWSEASKQFNIVICNFPNAAFAADSYYYLGVAYYNLAEYDLANIELSNYLKCQNNPQFFEEAVEYKFAIAEAFRNGARRRFFTSKKFPKWMTGRTLSVTIYDEVIAALPCHELAAKALYSKGRMLASMHDYRESIDAFQTLIRRFPKHELGPESYLMITRVYLTQSKWEFQNPDILALAQLNLRRFKQDFPREERLELAEQEVAEIEEVYARGLYDTGRFYERTCHPRASIIYYKTAIIQFPNTAIADCCRERLAILDCEFEI